MATRKVVTGTKAVIDSLNSINNRLNRSDFNIALEILCERAAEVARQKIKSSDHRQKYGDLLCEEVGVAVRRKNGTVYAPVTNTPEMRAQMYYAEYGAGITSGSGRKWLYPTTPNDKNPSKTIYLNGGIHKGEPYKWTKYSVAIRYMDAARKYIIRDGAAREFGEAVRNAVNFVRGRKPSSVELYGRGESEEE